MNDIQMQNAIDDLLIHVKAAYGCANIALHEVLLEQLKALLEIQLQRIKDHDSKDQP